MKISQKSVRGFLVILLVAQSINTVLFVGLKITQAKLGNYVYEQTAKPFLAFSSPNYPHYQKFQSVPVSVGSSVSNVKPHSK